MAFDVLDEHEQGELVQKWLRENAMAILVGIGLGLVLIFAWQQWKVHRVRQAAEAAVQYQALADAAAANKADEVAGIAATLRKDYTKSTYAVLAALYEADEAAGKNDLAAAATALDWARDHAGDASLQSLVGLRSARVKLAQGDADGAIKLLDGLSKDDYAAVAGEIRGDALLKLGRADDARAAYQDALTHIDAQAPTRNLVQMKLDDLATAASVKAVEPAPALAPAGEKLGS
jgi:predicted negative regulator of RcsB-dependent stress response